MKSKLMIFMLVIVLLPVSISAAAQNYKDMEEVIREGEDRIYLDVGGADITFDDTLNHIYISDKLEVTKSSSSITISSPDRKFFNWFNDNEHKIIIGTAAGYHLIDIDAGG
ncbi:MAG: hypothetical protein ACOCQH_01010, partial [Halanaerobiales bacterium]